MIVYQYLLINCNKCTARIQDVNKRGSMQGVTNERGKWELTIGSAPFFWKSEPAVK